MASDVVTTITFNHLPALSKELERQVSAAVRKAALDIEARAKETVPVDTGHLKNSIQSSIDTLSAEIGTAVDYSVYVEMGTHRMAARPYLGPAAELIRPQFLAVLEHLLS